MLTFFPYIRNAAQRRQANESLPEAVQAAPTQLGARTDGFFSHCSTRLCWLIAIVETCHRQNSGGSILQISPTCPWTLWCQLDDSSHHTRRLGQSTEHNIFGPCSASARYFATTKGHYRRRITNPLIEHPDWNHTEASEFQGKRKIWGVCQVNRVSIVSWNMLTTAVNWIIPYPCTDNCHMKTRQNHTRFWKMVKWGNNCKYGEEKKERKGKVK